MSQAILLSGPYCQDAEIVTVEGPQGPQGETGPEGPPGTAGANGSNGTNGVNGAIQIYTAGVPPAAPDDPTRAALFYPTGGGTLQQWDVASQAWV